MLARVQYVREKLSVFAMFQWTARVQTARTRAIYCEHPPYFSGPRCKRACTVDRTRAVVR